MGNFKGLIGTFHITAVPQYTYTLRQKLSAQIISRPEVSHIGPDVVPRGFHQSVGSNVPRHSFRFSFCKKSLAT